MSWLARLGVVLSATVVAVGFSVSSGLAEQGSPSPPTVQSITTVGPSGAPKVLVLDTTVDGGTSSPEVQNALADGFAVDLADATSWASLTASDFASYRAIVLGDNDCTGIGSYAAAQANISTWTSVVNGNVIVIGTDPDFHQGSRPGAVTLMQKAMSFATAQPGKTGLYEDLSCILPFGDDPAQLLNPLESGWTTSPTSGSLQSVHVVATNPFLSGLTDAALSNWNESVHEAFTTWPADFVPIAIVTDADPPLAYTAPDGVKGDPYILGRGANLVAGAISLTGTPASLQVGSGNATLTALVQPGGAPLVGATVTFTVTSGPNAGTTGQGTTGADGTATFSYASTLAGTDTWTASFTPAGAGPQTSNSVTVEWTAPPAPPAPPAPIVLTPTFAG